MVSDMSIETIAARIEEAVKTFNCLPMERPAGYRSSMPSIVRSHWESYGMNGDPWGLYKDTDRVKLPQPTNDAIDRADEAMKWGQWCRRKDWEVILRRANGERWYFIQGRLKKSRSTLSEWRMRGLNDILAGLKT